MAIAGPESNPEGKSLGSDGQASSGGELLGAVKGPMAIAGPEANPEGQSLGSDGQASAGGELLGAEERHGSRIVDT